MGLMIQEEKLYPDDGVKKGKIDSNLIEILVWIQWWDSCSDNHGKKNVVWIYESYKQEYINIYIHNGISSNTESFSIITMRISEKS